VIYDIFAIFLFLPPPPRGLRLTDSICRFPNFTVDPIPIPQSTNRRHSTQQHNKRKGG